jgi:hypothetical protein
MIRKDFLYAFAASLVLLLETHYQDNDMQKSDWVIESIEFGVDIVRKSMTFVKDGPTRVRLSMLQECISSLLAHSPML